jgi:hypothetical protein
MSAVLSARPTSARRNFFGMPMKPLAGDGGGEAVSSAGLRIALASPSLSRAATGEYTPFASNSARGNAESGIGCTPGAASGVIACSGFPLQKRYTNSLETVAKTVIAPYRAQSVRCSC